MSQEITQNHSWAMPKPLRLREGLRSLAAALASRFARARQRRTLAGLNDFMLRDLGITREEALGEADKPFWRG